MQHHGLFYVPNAIFVMFSVKGILQVDHRAYMVFPFNIQEIYLITAM